MAWHGTHTTIQNDKQNAASPIYTEDNKKVEDTRAETHENHS